MQSPRPTKTNPWVRNCQSFAFETPASEKVAMPSWQASPARTSRIATPTPESLAEPHLEIEQRSHPGFAQQRPMPGFGGDISAMTMMQYVGRKARQRQNCSARDSGQLASNQCCRDHQGVIEHVAMKIQRRIDRGRLRINRPRRRQCRAHLARRRGQSALI